MRVLSNTSLNLTADFITFLEVEPTVEAPKAPSPIVFRRLVTKKEPTNKLNKQTQLNHYFVDKIRVSLLNQVLPKDKQLKSNYKPPRAFYKTQNLTNNDQTKPNVRSESIPRDMWFGGKTNSIFKSVKNQKVHEAKIGTFIHEKAKNSFDYLQKLAENLRKEDTCIYSESTPYEYLKIITNARLEMNQIVTGKCEQKQSVSSKGIWSENFEQVEASPIKSYSEGAPDIFRKTNCISHEVIQGLDSILNDYNESKPHKSLKKRKSMKKRKVKNLSLNKGSRKRNCRLNTINIPTSNLLSLIKNLESIAC